MKIDKTSEIKGKSEGKEKAKKVKSSSPVPEETPKETPKETPEINMYQYIVNTSLMQASCQIIRSEGSVKEAEEEILRSAYNVRQYERFKKLTEEIKTSLRSINKRVFNLYYECNPNLKRRSEETTTEELKIIRAIKENYHNDPIK